MNPFRHLLPLLLVSAAAIVPARTQTFSEPATIFYGKVLGTGSAQDFLITAGDLEWSIRRGDGSLLTLRTTLFPLKDGEFSYRLEVPHAAFALGLGTTGAGVPLPPFPVSHLHEAITVDGEPAELIGPAGVSFTTEQLLRTATYRLDLALGRRAPDSDGDGMPDYWEDQFGLNKQSGSDAVLEANGDGITNLAAYLRGLDPRRDARLPDLLTTELMVYANGDTGLLLDTADADSSSAQLTYSLTALPRVGQILRRNGVANPQQPDAALTVGATFTQADLLSGRVYYAHPGGGEDPVSFSVQVRDENPAHAASSGPIALLVHQLPGALPSNLASAEAQRMENATRALLGAIVLDASAAGLSSTLSTPSSGLTGSALSSFRASYGPDRSYLLAGGAAGQTLTGGEARDVLAPAAGSATLRGGEGADFFQFRHFQSGRVGVVDFSPAQGDVLDLTRLPASSDRYAHLYLRLATTAGTPELQVDLDGNGIGFTNLVVSLPGLSSGLQDLYTLSAAGHLALGALRLEPRITVLASQSQASENGPTPGRFTLLREGSLDGDLTVALSLTGSAQNGIDYLAQSSSVTLPSGAASVDLVITPNADSTVEPAETVQLVLNPGSGYRLGAATQASLTIEDRVMLVDVSLLEPLAVRSTGSPAVFQVTRRDVLDRDVLIRFTLSGTATAGVDYNTVTAYVLLAANQTIALVSIMPKPGAVISGGAETVKVSLTADASYRISGGASATAHLVERLDQFPDWRTREFPSASGSAAAFATADTGSTGYTHLQRYAFGLDARAPTRAGFPRAVLVDGRLAVAFRRPVGVTDVIYRVTAATDLTRWSQTSLVAEPIPSPAGTTDPQEVYYRLPAGIGERAYLKVDLEWTP